MVGPISRVDAQHKLSAIFYFLFLLEFLSYISLFATSYITGLLLVYSDCSDFIDFVFEANRCLCVSGLLLL